MRYGVSSEERLRNRTPSFCLPGPRQGKDERTEYAEIQPKKKWNFVKSRQLKKSQSEWRHRRALSKLVRSKMLMQRILPPRKKQEKTIFLSSLSTAHLRIHKEAPTLPVNCCHSKAAASLTFDGISLQRLLLFYTCKILINVLSPSFSDDVERGVVQARWTLKAFRLSYGMRPVQWELE